MRKFAEEKENPGCIMKFWKQGILNTLQFQHKLYYLLNVEFFKSSFFPPKEDILMHEKNCFWNIQCVDMESSKLINY
jgi:hypothetical protein